MSDPIRCFDGTAKPHEPFWNIRNAAETGGEPEVDFYGYISEYSWLGDEITPNKFKTDLHKAGNGGPVTIRLNSPGGDVIAASVIRSIITDYPGPVTVRIDGMAASAAVIVAMAGKTVKIMDTAYMMIHDPAVIVMMAALDIEMLGQLHDQLKSIKQGIVDTYASKTGLSVDKLSRMMKDETWMSAQEAVSYGFASEVIKGGQAQNASKTAFVNALHNYVNVPQALLESSPQSEAVNIERAQRSKRLAAHAKQFLVKE
jgi:ATP-dependent Clp protease, protease subunit